MRRTDGGGGDDPGTGLTVNPTFLSFNQVGGIQPPSQIVTVNITAADAAFVFAGVPVGSPIPNWLSLSWSSLSNPAQLQVSILGNALTTGVHNVTVRIAIARADQSLIAYRDVPLTLNVMSLGTPGTTSGSLDGSFGSGGISAFHGYSGLNSAGQATAVDSMGRILVTGYTISGTANMALWRFTTTGALDTSFGSVGYVTYNRAAGGFSGDYGNAIAIDESNPSNPKILVAGHGRDASENDDDLVVWRYNSNGTLDATFNGDGIFVLSDVAGIDVDAATAIALDNNGNIVVVGRSISALGDSDLIVLRLTPTGALDTTFAAPNGYVIVNHTAFDDSNDYGNAVKIVPGSGQILVAGSSGNAFSARDMVVWGFTSAGTLDNSFGVDYNNNGTRGFIRHDGATGANSDDVGNALTLDSFGNIIVAGSSYLANGSDMVIWRLTPDGAALDTSWGGEYDGIGGRDGYVRYDRAGGNDAATGVAVDGQDRIIAAGHTSANGDSDVTVWRYTDDFGTLDTTFGNGGVAFADTAPATRTDNDLAFGMTLDGNGKILATGRSFINGATSIDMTLYRFLP